MICIQVREMIIAIEGNSGIGKTFIIDSIIKYYDDRSIVDTYKSWSIKPPAFINNNPFVKRIFESALFADIASNIKFETKNLLLDRSIISGEVYYKYRLINEQIPDITYDPRYFEFYVEKLMNGVNSPLIIVYFYIDCEQLFLLSDRRKEHVNDTLDIYEDIFNEKSCILKKYDIKLIKIKYDFINHHNNMECLLNLINMSKNIEN